MTMLLVRTGVRYCIEHDGIANEDDDVCDFARDEPKGCKFRQLVYRAKRRKP